MQGVVKSSNTSKLISAITLTKLGLTHVPQRYVLPSSQRPNLHHIIVHSSTSLPIIDLSNLQNPSLRSHTLDEIQMACKEVGFFQVHAGPAEWWSKKCNRLTPQVKKRPPNFNQ